MKSTQNCRVNVGNKQSCLPHRLPAAGWTAVSVAVASDSVAASVTVAADVAIVSGAVSVSVAVEGAAGASTPVDLTAVSTGAEAVSTAATEGISVSLLSASAAGKAEGRKHAKLTPFTCQISA